ncbi:MAG: hypothetical protein J2P53_14980 [Bradyrhizobiaceae bacterium]|nr:hypothetical protein [Bradyrhizobiaceae bacterium]
MGKKEREKGARIEREIVNRHVDAGLRAERYPASGATRFRGSGHDVDVYVHGLRLSAEIKGRSGGEGFALLERWLADYDLLFLRRDRKDPLVVMPWDVWERLVKWADSQDGTPSIPPSSRNGHHERISARPEPSGSPEGEPDHGATR